MIQEKVWSRATVTSRKLFGVFDETIGRIKSMKKCDIIIAHRTGNVSLMS
jgi:hypothetical protein